MEQAPTIDTLLTDIEFELIQGIVFQDDLGWGVQSVKHHQNRVRSEVMEGPRGPGSRELAGRQFQINDMLLTLLQEAAERIRNLEHQLYQSNDILRDMLLKETGETEIPAWVRSHGNWLATAGLDQAMHSWSPEELVQALGIAVQNVEPQVRESNLPLIGPLITRIRSALHGPALFYVRRLAEKQAEINAKYGKWILYLNQVQEKQWAELSALRAQIAHLEAQLEGGEGAQAKDTT